MATVASVNDYVEDYIKGFSGVSAFASRATIKVLREFCEETHIFKQDLADISVVAATNSYTLTLPVTQCSAVELIQIDRVLYKEDGEDDEEFIELSPLSGYDMRDATNQGLPYTDGTPRHYWIDPNSDKLYLVPTPEEASTSGLTVTAVLKPAFTATTFPDQIADKYIDTIAYGIAAKVCEMPAHKWYNLEIAASFQARYVDGIRKVKQAMQAGFTSKKLHASLPDMAGSRNSGLARLRENYF